MGVVFDQSQLLGQGDLDIFGQVYGLFHPDTDELRYVGQTVRRLTARLQGHLHPSAGDQTHKANWIRSLVRRPFIRTLGVAYSQKQLDTLEIQLIQAARARGVRLLNVEEGGRRGSSGPHSEEWKARQALTMTGRTHSPETKKRLSELKKGKLPYPEALETLIQANTGRVASKETRERMRSSHKGKSHNLESIAKMRAKKASKETRAKMSVAQKVRFKDSGDKPPDRSGKTHSEESRARMSESWRARSPDTEVTRKRKSEAMKALWQDPEYRKRMAKSRKKGGDHGSGV